MIISMKYLLIFLIAITVSAQSTSRGISVKTTVPPPNEVKPEKEKEPVAKTSSLDDEELDKVFYTYRSVSKETLDGISPTTIKFKRVQEDSKWMRKIKKEIRHIHFTEYMYIVRYQNYLTLILYQLDPELHLQSPSQVEFINVKETESNQDLE